MPARRTGARCASSSSAPSAGQGERPVSGRAALLGAGRTARAAGAVRRLAARPAPRSSPASRSRRPAIAPAWLLDRFDPLVGADELAGSARARAARRPGQPAEGHRADALALPEARRRRMSPIGLRFPEGTQVEQLAAWRLGRIEVQDEGSQLICLGCEAAPGMLVVDLCAGAGGKTLALAAEMANRGRIVACDTDRGRLSRLPQRAAARRRRRSSKPPARSRARGRGARRPRGPGRSRPGRRALLGHRHLAAQSGDALAGHAGAARPAHRAPGAFARYRRGPCSSPAAFWFMRSARCSPRRGRDQADGARPPVHRWFRSRSPMPAGRAAGTGLLLSPGHDGTDGFFVARWRRPC